MIRINLLVEKPDKRATYFAHGLVAAVAFTVVMGTCLIFQHSVSTSLDSLESQKGMLNAELSKLKKITKQVEGLEENKKLLQQKLVTIATLKAKKKAPVHVLDDVGKALPERAWLTSVKQSTGAVEVSGVALDNITVTRFMSALFESDYFSDVELIYSTQYIQGQAKLQQFLLSAKLAAPLLGVAEQVETEAGSKKRPRRRAQRT